MKRSLLLSFVFFLFFACGDDVPGSHENCRPVAEQQFDQTKAYIRLKNNTSYDFSQVNVQSSEGSDVYSAVRSDCFSAYQEAEVEVEGAIATIEGGNATIGSSPAGFFGTTLLPDLYTCVISTNNINEGHELPWIRRRMSFSNPVVSPEGLA